MNFSDTALETPCQKLWFFCQCDDLVRLIGGKESVASVPSGTQLDLSFTADKSTENALIFRICLDKFQAVQPLIGSGLGGEGDTVAVLPGRLGMTTQFAGKPFLSLTLKVPFKSIVLTLPALGTSPKRTLANPVTSLKAPLKGALKA